MSANNLRNVLPQRTHKERSQPSYRKKLGLLEKHKDYKERSINYHRKQKILHNLHSAAAFRNPDEYYHGMNSSQTKHGQHIVERKGRQYTQHEKLHIKFQDINYINHYLKHHENKINKLKNNLHMLTQNIQNNNNNDMSNNNNNNTTTHNKHTVFVDNKTQQQTFEPTEYFNTNEQLLKRKFNRLPTNLIESNESVILNKTDRNNRVDSNTINNINKQQLELYRQIQDRLKSQQKLHNEINYLQTQRNLMNKGARQKIVQYDKFGDVDEKKTIFKWRLQRKK